MLKRSFPGSFPCFAVMFMAKTADQKIGLIKNKQLINYSELSTRFGLISVVLKIKIFFQSAQYFIFESQMVNTHSGGVFWGRKRRT